MAKCRRLSQSCSCYCLAITAKPFRLYSLCFPGRSFPSVLSAFQITASNGFVVYVQPCSEALLQFGLRSFVHFSSGTSFLLSALQSLPLSSDILCSLLCLDAFSFPEKQTCFVEGLRHLGRDPRMVACTLCRRLRVLP